MKCFFIVDVFLYRKFGLYMRNIFHLNTLFFSEYFSRLSIHALRFASIIYAFSYSQRLYC